MPYYILNQSVVDGGTTFTFASLIDKFGNSLPSFNDTPLVDVIPVDDMQFYRSAEDSTSIILVPTGVGSSTSPHTVHLVITSLDEVTGPTPSSDYTAQNEHLFCTPFDLRLEDKRLSFDAITDAELMRYCSQASGRIRAVLSRFYNDQTLRHKDAPWFRGFYSSPVTIDPEDVAGNQFGNKGAFEAEAAGFLGLTVNSSFDVVFTEYNTIVFTADTTFSIKSNIRGALGSGTVGSSFTPAAGQFTLSSDASFGTHGNKNRFYFMTYIWDPMIVDIATWLAAGLCLMNKFAQTTKGVQSVAKDKLKMAAADLKLLLRPYEPDGIRLARLGPRALITKSAAYDINFLGYDLTAINSNNKDSLGNRGETGSFFDIYGVEGDQLLW